MGLDLDASPPASPRAKAGHHLVCNGDSLTIPGATSQKAYSIQLKEMLVSNCYPKSCVPTMSVQGANSHRWPVTDGFNLSDLAILKPRS